MNPPRVRSVSRALLIDPRGRVLLLRGMAAGYPPCWYAPGGAVERGESYEHALIRELEEETATRVAPAHIGTHVWTRRSTFCWSGVDEMHDERYFLVRVTDADVDAATRHLSKDAVHKHRWWSVDQLARSDERFAPTRIAELLHALVRGEASVPIDAGD